MTVEDRNGKPIEIGDEIDHLGRQHGYVVDIDETKLPLISVEVGDEIRMIPYMDLTIIGSDL